MKKWKCQLRKANASENRWLISFFCCLSFTLSLTCILFERKRTARKAESFVIRSFRCVLASFDWRYSNIQLKITWNSILFTHRRSDNRTKNMRSMRIVLPVWWKFSKIPIGYKKIGIATTVCVTHYKNGSTTEKLNGNRRINQYIICQFACISSSQQNFYHCWFD